MPKQKTKRAATKRFKKSATGKILRTCGGKAHLNACKTRKRKRNLRGMQVVADAFQPTMQRQLATYNP
jgi:large subunit ribosomal protein L35